MLVINSNQQPIASLPLDPAEDGFNSNYNNNDNGNNNNNDNDNHDNHNNHNNDNDYQN